MAVDNLCDYMTTVVCDAEYFVQFSGSSLLQQCHFVNSNTNNNNNNTSNSNNAQC